MTSPVRPDDLSLAKRARGFVRRHRPRRMGLRTRILLTFGIGALILSGVLTFLTYTLTRSNLREREGELGISNQV
ncbi:MAG: hypothetical protein EBV80_00685, partial [Acidimicrobiia bacterium]|nr:hypothetical protein [Acidimicrobiia bacterium]